MTYEAKSIAICVIVEVSLLMWAMVLINNTVRRRKALGLADAMTTVLEHYKTTDTSK